MSLPGVEEAQDLRRLQPLPTPAQLLGALPEGDNWTAQSRRSVARLLAYFMLCEDPQRRMDIRPVETLNHQVSLVRHILQSENLHRVLVADEVGLGKTIEAGLLLQELLAQRPGLRVLYLAPARLVSNVRREFDRLGLSFRQWSANDGDARLTDPRVIASIHRAVHISNFKQVLSTNPWDIIIVDECHHLSAWSPDGADPTVAYQLVRDLASRLPSDGRLILLSGTPHQGHLSRFDNLLRFLRDGKEPIEQLSGRVIYRTKDDIYDWDGHPLFPQRQVNAPLLVDLGPAHRQWIENIHDYYRPPSTGDRDYSDARRRAAGWRCAQAMQWAASSPHAGLGYLVRQAIRHGWDLRERTLRNALAMLRPYRLGTEDEPLDQLYQRIVKEVDRQRRDADVEDIEEMFEESAGGSRLDPGLDSLLREGIEIVREAGDDKWNLLAEKLLGPAGEEKIVLFAQPIETVTSLARFLTRATGKCPALIIGGQSDAERAREVEAFWRPDGAQFLVSSRAGGEGINLQVARRLIHIDVPWNPMDLEQRVGRIHRFGSRETIIVDTLVVKDSREADAFHIAREKLRLIASTLVEKERFESVFSRVMCLLPQEELQSLLLNAPQAPFNEQDELLLSEMVQQGFRAWKDFHDRYSEQQRSIERQNPGLVEWSDVAFLLTEYGGAQEVAGFHRQRFRRDGQVVRRVVEPVTALRLGDGKDYVCGSEGEALVYGPGETITPKVGLNLKPVAELLRKLAFPETASGAAFLRWPAGERMPAGIGEWPVGVLALVRQTLRIDRMGGWLEQGLSLHCYLITSEGVREVEGEDKGLLLRGMFRAGVRKAPETDPELTQRLVDCERELSERLRRPTETELESQIRHAVIPLLAGILTDRAA